MKERLGMIFTADELKRMRLIDNIDNKGWITIDLHHLTVRQAKRLLNNLIAINRNECTIRVIHGYIHGTKIKNMIQNELDNRRITDKAGMKHNPGVTVLKLSKTA